MDELWERAVETAIDGRSDGSPVRTLTLDGAVKCVNGRLPPPSLLEKFQSLEHLSIANVGLSSLEKFPRLWNLQRLILSDNRIFGGLECLVDANLRSLRDLDLSNNRIQFFEDLVPLAKLKLVSLDLYECPVTKIKDYRTRVFGLIGSLKYLDKLDADENDEDDEEDDDDDDEDEDEGDDPGSGEIDGDDRCRNGKVMDGVIDVDEDGESDEELIEEVRCGLRGVNGSNSDVGLQAMGGDVDGGEGEGDDDELEEIDEDESDDDDDDEEDEGEDVVEVYEIEDSDDEDEGVDYDEEEEDEDEEEDQVGPGSAGRGVIGDGGEIDGHEQGEEDSDDDGEYEEDDGEDEQVEDFCVRPVGQAEEDGEASDLDPEDEVDSDSDAEAKEEVEDDDGHLHREAHLQASSSRPHLKRKREEDGDTNNDDGEDGVEDGSLKPR